MTAVVVVARDAAALATATAERLVTAVVEAQADRGEASLVLTGGRIGTAVLAALRDDPNRTAVDWSRVTLWWGDERYVERASPERNERAAREALLDHVDLDPARVHPMGALDGPDGEDVDAAAARYAAELAAAAPHGVGVPVFDVVLLGVGPDGHIASIFPEAPATHDERLVLGVHGSPKPPPTRITLGFDALTSAREVWLLASGAEKADVVALALSGPGRVQLPVAGAVGHQQTLWLLDEDAASALPPTLRRL